MRFDNRDFDVNIQIQIDEFDQKTKRPQYRLRWYHPLSLIKSRMERLVGRSGKILDIGCGAGQWLNTFGDKWEKYGVDVSPVAAEIARDFANADVFCGTIEEYEAPVASFNVISSFALIEHLKEPRELLTWSYNHLKPGGVLLLMTGDRESIVAQKLGYDWPLYLPREHLHFFSGRSLHHLVLDAGFKVIWKEWRPVQYQGISRFSIYAARVKDILGLLTRSLYDRFYVYGQKSK
ncbi:MAG: class I SAM-dependent methyltransferase [Planctomycetota bacterium]|jgi:SAM-dependent methyltransferase